MIKWHGLLNFKYKDLDEKDYLKSVTAACLWVFLYLVWLKTEKHALLGSKQLATEEYIISFPGEILGLQLQ